MFYRSDSVFIPCTQVKKGSRLDVEQNSTEYRSGYGFHGNGLRTDIDRALIFHLKSHFLFKDESQFILDLWLKLGNKKMWRKTGNNAFLWEKRQIQSNLALE